jgi:hypothetical protein
MSDFGHEVAENYALLGYYTASSGKHQCFVTTYRTHPQVNPEDGTDSLSRNAGKKLLLIAA